VLKGIDVRDYGSGATGATNVMRTLGKGAFVAVLLGDAIKGYAPVLVTWYLFESHDLQVASGLAAVLGHDFPVYIGFRGGRGVATSFGVYAALAFPVSVSLVAVALFIVHVPLHVPDIDQTALPPQLLCWRSSRVETTTRTARRFSGRWRQRWCWCDTRETSSA
jgi:hypothetical protein